VTGGSTQRWPKFRDPGGDKGRAISGIASPTASAVSAQAAGAGDSACDSRSGTPSSEGVLPPLAGIAGSSAGCVVGAKPLVQPAFVADDDVIDL